MAGWNSYLDLLVTRLEAVTGVNLAERTAVIDPEKLIKIPRWPKVLVTDFGGNIDRFSGVIYDRQVAITICVLSARGVIGGKASKLIGTVAEAIVTALTHTRTDGTMRLIEDTEESAQSAGGREIYFKTLIFTYSII